MCHMLYTIFYIFYTFISCFTFFKPYFIFSTSFPLPYLLSLNHYFVSFESLSYLDSNFLNEKNIRLNLFLIHLFHKTLLNTKMEDLLNIKHKIITLYIYKGITLQCLNYSLFSLIFVSSINSAKTFL